MKMNQQRQRRQTQQQGSVDYRPTQVARLGAYLQPKKNSSAMRLAETLGAANETMRTFANVYAEQNAREAREAEEYLTNRGISDEAKYQKKLESLIDDGVLPKSLNKHYIKAYQTNHGKRSASDYELYLKNKYRESGLQGETDPRKVREFLQSTRSTFIESKGQIANEDFQATFAVGADGVERNLMVSHAADVDKRIEAQVLSDVQETNRLAASRIDFSNPKWRESEAFTQWQMEVDSAFESLAIPGGISKRDFNLTIAESLLTEAEAANDVEMANLVYELKAGTGRLGDIAEVKAAHTKTVDKILDKDFEEDRRAVWQRGQQVEKVTHDVLKDYYEAVEQAKKDGLSVTSVSIEPAVKKLLEYDPRAPFLLTDLQTRLNAETPSDRNVVRDLYSRIDSGLRREDVLAELRRGTISPGDWQNITQLITNRATSTSNNPNSIYKDTTRTTLRDTLKKTIMKPSLLGGPPSIDSVMRYNDALIALEEFDAEWVRENGDTSSLAYKKALDAEIDMQTRLYADTNETADEVQYVTTADVLQAAPTSFDYSKHLVIPAGIISRLPDSPTPEQLGQFIRQVPQLDMFFDNYLKPEDGLFGFLRLQKELAAQKNVAVNK